MAKTKRSMSVGARLLAARKRHKLNLAQVGHEIGVASGTLSAIEREIMDSRTSTIEKVLAWVEKKEAEGGSGNG